MEGTLLVVWLEVAAEGVAGGNEVVGIVGLPTVGEQIRRPVPDAALSG